LAVHQVHLILIGEMAKSSKLADEGVSKAEKTAKKVKKGKKDATTAEVVEAEPASGLKLFKGKESELDSVFGKGVSV
jgi:hypothetical protein